jgi:hypothetical protein
MRRPALLAVSTLLALSVGACAGNGAPASSAPTGSTPAGSPPAASAATRVEAQQVAERLLGQLRDGDFEAAHATLSTGSAGEIAADPAALAALLNGGGSIPKSWELSAPNHITDANGDSAVEITGTVTFADDATGTVRIEMEALGSQADPWRVNEFELSRD